MPVARSIFRHHSGFRSFFHQRVFIQEISISALLIFKRNYFCGADSFIPHLPELEHSIEKRFDGLSFEKAVSWGISFGTAKKNWKWSKIWRYSRSWKLVGEKKLWDWPGVQNWSCYRWENGSLIRDSTARKNISVFKSSRDIHVGPSISCDVLLADPRLIDELMNFLEKQRFWALRTKYSQNNLSCGWQKVYFV